MKNLLLIMAGVIVGFGIGRYTGPKSGEAPDPAAPAQVAKIDDSKPEGSQAKSVSLPEATVPDINDGEMKFNEPNFPSGGPDPDADKVVKDTPEQKPKVVAGEAEIEAPPPALLDLSGLPNRLADKLESMRRSSNLSRRLASAEPVSQMTPALKGLLGKFDGDIVVDEENGRTWQMTMDTQGTITNGSLVGKSYVRLSRNGKVFATSTQNGNLQNIRAASDGKTSFLIQIPETWAMEAFYDPATKSVYGNFYSKTKRGYVYRGYATLTKRGK